MSNVGRWLRATILSGAMLMCAAPAHAQAVSESFRSDVLSLLELTGAGQLGVQMASAMNQQIVNMLRTTSPDLPERALVVLETVINEETAKGFDGPDGLMARMTDVYARHFTQAEVRGLIAFYKTDLGRKVTSEMPGVVQEAMAVGQKWGEERTPAMIEVLRQRLVSEGLLK